MSKEPSWLLRTQLRSLVSALSPVVLGEQYADSVFKELLNHIEQGVNTKKHYHLNEAVAEIRAQFPQSVLPQTERIIEDLLRLKDPNTVARYLVLVATLMESHPTNMEHDKRSFYGDHRSVSNYVPTVDSFEHTNIDRFSDRRSIYSGAMNEPRDLIMEDMLIPYFEGQVPEKDILRCISYTMVGTTSDLLPLQDGEVTLPANITNGLSGLLHLTLESGLIYQKLENIVEKSNMGGSSQVQIALLSFISSEVSEYVQFVNDLSTRQNFTLKSIYADVYDTLVKLRFLLFVYMNTLPMPSYEKLSFIHSFDNHGDPSIQTCARAMLDYTMEPFLNSLSKWVVKGELNARSDHFFISQTQQNELALKNDIGVQFHADRVPSFICLELSRQIYTIGSTIVFLKLYCREVQWLNDFSQKIDLLLQQMKSGKTNFVNESKFHTLITNTYDEILNYLTHTLHTKFHFMKIINALCDYLLMARGDFIQHIIDNGSELLQEPSSSLTGHQLTRLLHESVLQTTSRYDLKQSDKNIVLNNLDARLLAIGHGNVGWDVFTLDYRIETPLNFLLNDQANQHKKEYLRVFNYLWKIKRLRNSFGEQWKQSNSVKVRDRKLTRIRLIHNFMLGFILSIESFIFNEIIDKSFGELKDNFLQSNDGSQRLTITRIESNLKVPTTILKPSTDYLKGINEVFVRFDKLEHGFRELAIKDIQKIHSDFLHSITQHKLMDGTKSTSRGKISNKFYINQSNNLINIAFRFVLSEMELNKLIAQESSAFEIDGEGDRRRYIIYNNLLMLFNEFNSDLKTFVGDLSNDDDVQLRYLGASLNR